MSSICKKCNRPIKIGEQLENDGAAFYHQRCPPRDILEYFAFQHLPEHLKRVSEPFCLLAEQVDKLEGDPREKAVALRKLLEAKDAAVRAAL